MMGPFIIQCEFCEQKFNSRQNFYLHVNKSHRTLIEQTWFYCERCDNFYPSLEILRSHENQAHDDQKMRTCPFCPKVMTRMSAFYKHANEAHKEQLMGSWFCCETCQNYYPSKFILDKHKMSTHANATKGIDRIQCDFCPKQLISTYAYYAHANKTHLYLLEGRWFSCEECRKYFPNKPVLESHKSSVHSKAALGNKKSEKVTCEFCAHTLRNRAVYYKHTNKVHQELLIGHWHPCDSCQMFYPTLDVLEKHRRQRHQPDGATGQGHGKPPVKIKCKFCPRTFNGNIWYYKHANIAHFNLVVDRWVLCDKCETYVPSEISLKRHQRKYHADIGGKPLSRVHCKFCPKMFITNSVYYLHANRAHRNLLLDKWALCQVCQKFYPTKKDVELHKCRGPPEEQRIDTRSHFVQCGFCQVIENNASGFYRHANKEHQDQLAASQWIMCTLCNNYYPDKEVLRSHKKHSHDRALQPKTIRCKFCSKDLPDHDAFYKHANIAHLMGIIGKWLFCVRCQYFYPNRSVLETHQSEDHDEVAKVILVENLTEVGLAGLEGNSNVTVVDPSTASDALSFSNKTNKDSIIVLANSHGLTTPSGEANEVERGQCAFCSKAFAERHHFINHANKVHRDEIVATWLCCRSCGKYFPDENVLALHNSHTHNTKPRSDDVDETEGGESKLFCDFCPKSFKHRSYYFCHANKAHPEELATHWIGCDECDRRYPDKTVLASHKARFHRTQKFTETETSKQFYVFKSTETTTSPKTHRAKLGQDEFDYQTSGATEQDFWSEMETDIQNFSVVSTTHGDQQETLVVVNLDTAN